MVPEASDSEGVEESDDNGDSVEWFPNIRAIERILLITIGILDYVDEDGIATDYGFRIKLDLYGNYSKYPLNN